MFQPSGPGHVLSTTDEIWANTTTSESGVESNPMSNKKVKGDHNLTVGLLRNLVFKNQAPQGLADPLPSSTSSQPSSSLDPSDSPDSIIFFFSQQESVIQCQKAKSETTSFLDHDTCDH